MKKNILIILIGLLIRSNFIFAQPYTILSSKDSVNKAISEALHNTKKFYEQLDYTSMHTNLLFNYGFLVLNDIETWYNGIPIMTDLSLWRYIYNAIDHSIFNGTYGLPNDTFLLNKYSKLEKYGVSKVGLSILYFTGDYLPDTVIKEMISRNDFKSPPYKTMKIFSGTTLLQCSYDKTVCFKYSPELFFSNQKQKVKQFLIHFDNDDEYIDVDINKEQTFYITYTSIGEKSIRFKLITDQNDTLISYSRINILTLINEKPNYEGFISITDTNSFRLFQNNSDPNINLPNAYYAYYEGCDGILDKPVIIAEGFDVVGDMDATYLLNKWQSTINNLRARGYDIFCLNVNTPTSSLLDNAQIVKTLIKGINTAKQQHLEGIYMGESMGGILGRIALKQLENEGFDHQIGLYVSYDAPHKGAYVPEGIQFTLQDIATSLPMFAQMSYILGAFQNALGLNTSPLSIYYTYNSIGARQLLATHVAPGAYMDYYSMQNYLKNLGYPEKCRNVSVVNGSNCGTLQENVNPGNLIYNRKIILGVYNIFFKAWYTLHFPQNQKVASTTIIKYNFMLPSIHTYVHKISYGKPMPFVNAPGGYIDNTIPAIFPTNSSDVKFCFVPTVSAIDIDQQLWDNGNFTFLNDFGTNNTANLIMQNLTPFDDIHINKNNTFHTTKEIDLTNGIENDEIMYVNMYMQNRQIEDDRDFEAERTMTVGNNITGIEGAGMNNNPYDLDENHNKYVKTGNFIVKAGTNVKFKARTEINLEPGFETEDGATFTAEIGDICSTYKVLPTISSSVIQGNLKICGENVYKVEDVVENSIIEWQLRGENIYISNFVSMFTIPSNLPMGQYTLSCTIRSEQNEVTSTKIINVICNPRIFVNKEFFTINNDDEVTVYPNPCKNRFCILINSKDKNNDPIIINVYDILSNIVYSSKFVYNYINVDFSNKPDGIFIAEIIFNNKKHYKIIIRQK